MKAIVTGLLGLILILAAIVGYICNIVGIMHTTGFSGMLALRIIGIFFPPFGAVLGYL